MGHGEFKSLMRLRGWRPATRLRTAELAELAPPTLFVWGEDDPLGSPDDVRAGVEAAPDARVEAMDTGHLPWFGRPEVCARLIREWT